MTACGADKGVALTPARCRDLPPAVTAARATAIFAAAATALAEPRAERPGAEPPEGPGELAAMAASEPAYLAVWARGTEDLQRRRELATALPRERRLTELETAFQHQSVAELEAFLERWLTELPPRSNEELGRLSAAEQSAYALFAAFVAADVPAAPVGHDDAWERPDGRPAYPADARYVVIPTTMAVSCTGRTVVSLPEDSGRSYAGDYMGLLQDFRPPVALGKTRPLYLSDERDAILTGFLGAHLWDEVYADRPDFDREPRTAFWRQLVAVAGSGFSTDPQLSITFNEDMTKAWINFQQGAWLGVARAELRNGRWVIVESATTGIT